MSKESSKKESPWFGPKFRFVVSAIVVFVLLVVAIFVRYRVANPVLSFLIGMLALFLLFNFWMLVQKDASISQQKKSRREHRRHLAKKKEAANLKAQLRKRDFETRLRSYTRTEGMNQSQDDPESQMEFWERSEEYSRTPTRPIELIRYLLQRISKLVGQR